jgi:hypothetical protein
MLGRERWVLIRRGGEVGEKKGRGNIHIKQMKKGIFTHRIGKDKRGQEIL